MAIITNILIGFGESILEELNRILAFSLTSLLSEAPKSIAVYSEIETALTNVQRVAILPVAGLLLAYLFALELIQLITERNNMAEFDFQKVFMLAIKTGLAIILVSNSMDICLAMLDIGNYFVNRAGSFTGAESFSTFNFTFNTDTNISSVATLVILFFVTFITYIAMYITIFMIIITRLISMSLYVLGAPIPLTTLFFSGQISEMGKNYLKNLAAFSLQLLFIYGTIYIFTIIQGVSFDLAGDSDAFFYEVLVIALHIGLCVALTKAVSSCLALAKSLVGAT